MPRTNLLSRLGPGPGEKVDAERDETVPVEGADDAYLLVLDLLRNNDGIGESDEARDGLKAQTVVSRRRRSEELARRPAGGAALEDVALAGLAGEAASGAPAARRVKPVSSRRRRGSRQSL